MCSISLSTQRRLWRMFRETAIQPLRHVTYTSINVHVCAVQTYVYIHRLVMALWWLRLQVATPSTCTTKTLPNLVTYSIACVAL